jgi:acyl carrier protein
MLFEKVKTIICDYFELDEDEVTPGTTFAEIGADSLDMVDIAMSLEDDFNTEITDELLAVFKTVGDVVKYLEEVL